MTETPILTARQTQDITLDGVTYRIAPLTHGRHAEVQAALAAHRAPSTELINDTLRQAALDDGNEEMAEALVAEEDASDALQAFLAAAPPTLDDAGLATWYAEHAAEITRLRREVLRAARKARLAREIYGDSDAAIDLADRAAQAGAAAAQHLVAAGLVSIDGADWRGEPDDVAQFPSGHVAVLAEAVSRMLTPSRDAAKN